MISLSSGAPERLSCRVLGAEASGGDISSKKNAGAPLSGETDECVTLFASAQLDRLDEGGGVDHQTRIH